MHAMLVWGHMLPRENLEKSAIWGVLLHILIRFCLKTFLIIFII